MGRRAKGLSDEVQEGISMSLLTTLCRKPFIVKSSLWPACTRAIYPSANPAQFYLDRELMPSSEQIELEVMDGKGQKSDWDL
jgi:hypothetical protein